MNRHLGMEARPILPALNEVKTQKTPPEHVWKAEDGTLRLLPMRSGRAVSQSHRCQTVSSLKG